MSGCACRVALVGIGNPIAGDDGAGPAALRLLEARWHGHPRLRFLYLESDLFALADHLASADRFLFLDAFAGDPPGEIRQGEHGVRGFAPSFHQLDLSAVMASLEALGLAVPFPAWEVWGVTIAAPDAYREGLSPAVEAAVAALVRILDDRLRVLLDGAETLAPDPCKLSMTPPGIPVHG